MADISTTGTAGNLPVQGYESSSPVAPQGQTQFEASQNTARDNFADYLNKQMIEYETKAHDQQFFDTASFISKNSVYNSPDQFKP